VTEQPGRQPRVRAAVRGLFERLAPVGRWLHRHRAGERALICVTALAGALVAVTLWGNVRADVGPVRATLALQAGVHGGTEIDIPPLGRLAVKSHVGPLHLRATVNGVDVDAAERALNGAVTTEQLEAQVSHDARHAMIVLIAKWVVLAVLGGGLAVLVVFRRPRATVLGVGVVVLGVVVSSGVAAVSWDSKAFANPRFSGVLTSAPALIGGVEDIPEKFDTYRRELAKIVTNISKLYDATRALPSSISPHAIPVLWVSDIHDNPEAFTVMQSIVTEFGAKAVVDTGDISDHGTAAENQIYNPIDAMGIPYVYVRGNHDSFTTQRYLARMKNVRVLDNGRILDVAGIRWAGIGDPNFTPDKTVNYGHESDVELIDAGNMLANAIDASPEKVDVALVHEPTMAVPLQGNVPLILDGHIHRREHQSTPKTLTLTQGSSGGAGLRNLEGAQPLPLEMSVLYFDPVTHALLAVDDITLSGLGIESVQIQRHRAAFYKSKNVNDPQLEPSLSPTLSPTPSPT
jgi:predicted phosphodiesterase